jgi:hypothetical protein
MDPPQPTGASRRASPWVSLVAALSLVGCGASATISRLDGSTINGKILRSDQHALYVRRSSGG